MGFGTDEMNAKEFAELLILKGRVDAFIDFVKRERYGIDRKDCATLLGFSLEEEDAGTDRK